MPSGSKYGTLPRAGSEQAARNGSVGRQVYGGSTLNYLTRNNEVAPVASSRQGLTGDALGKLMG